MYINILKLFKNTIIMFYAISLYVYFLYLYNKIY